ncbi:MULTISPECIES: hypothetical protein [Corynebacterium]|uniref:hypothetical protein n=1 Tax=Corynebacterium TaxID=1716 RepID=UPI00124F4340|nr:MULTISPECIES: hypothetical protein [Corynebacterium]
MIDKAVAAELDTTDLHIEADQVFAQVGAAAKAIDDLIARNARVAQDQTEYQRRFDKLNSDHARLLAGYDKLLTLISNLESRQAAYRYCKEQLATLDPASIEVTPYLWHPRRPRRHCHRRNHHVHIQGWREASTADRQVAPG